MNTIWDASVPDFPQDVVHIPAGEESNVCCFASVNLDDSYDERLVHKEALWSVAE